MKAAELSARIQDRFGIPAEDQWLFHNLHPMGDDDTLADHAVAEWGTVWVVRTGVTRREFHLARVSGMQIFIKS